MTLRKYAAEVALLVALVSPALVAQESFEPTLNQPGKDVQWVPTPGPLVEKMLDMARLTPADRL